MNTMANLPGNKPKHRPHICIAYNPFAGTNSFISTSHLNTDTATILDNDALDVSSSNDLITNPWGEIYCMSKKARSPFLPQVHHAANRQTFPPFLVIPRSNAAAIAPDPPL